MYSLLLIYFLLIGLGASLASARLLTRILGLPGASFGMRLFFGFGIFPVIISWLGFAGFFRIPYSEVASGAVLAAYGVWWIMLGIRQRRFPVLSMGEWLEKAPPYLLVVVLVFITFMAKTCYLTGGINNFDDMRALAMTSSFSANYLKPAFPLNPSVPISYGYYLYETAAFFYAAVAGYGWPSTAVLAVNLYAVIFFYIAFWHAIRPYEGAMPRWGAFVAMLSVTFFGLDSLFFSERVLEARHIDWWNRMQVSQMATYFNWVYHYLLAAGFVLGGCYCFSMLCKTKQLNWLVVAALSFALAPCYSALTGAWAVPLVFILVIACLYCVPNIALLLVKRPITIGIIVLCGIFVLLPQFFTFSYRPIFAGFSAVPQWWFSRATVFPWNWDEAIPNTYVGFIEYGPLLFIGIPLIPCLLLAGLKRRSMPWIALGAMGMIGILGLFFTTSPLADWFWRGGSLYITIISAAAFAWGCTLIVPYLSPVLFLILIAFGIVPGFLNFMTEQRFRTLACVEPSASTIAYNGRTNLHDVIISGSLHVDPEPFFQVGRLPLVASPLLNHYGNSWTLLVDILGWDTQFTPCTQTHFGSSTPSGYYVIYNRDGDVRKSCASGLAPK